LFVFYFVFLFLFGNSDVVEPIKFDILETNDQSYIKCKKEAMKKYNTSMEKIRYALKLCKETYNTVDIYISCKKQAIMIGLQEPSKLRSLLEKCKPYLSLGRFNSNNNLPFFAKEQYFVFAGIDFNRILDFKHFFLPNFFCPTLNNQTEKHFVFLSNQLTVFSKFREIPSKFIEIIYKKIFSEKNKNFINNFGKFFFRNSKPMVYFPSIRCAVNRDLGPNYRGINLYYLFDSLEKRLWPYLGVVFYQNNRAPFLKNLLQKLKSYLGHDFQVSRPMKGWTYLTEASQFQVNQNGYPFNMCETPRSNKRIIAIKNSQKKPRKVSELFIVNIKNTCIFGDLMVTRLLNNIRK